MVGGHSTESGGMKSPIVVHRQSTESDSAPGPNIWGRAPLCSIAIDALAYVTNANVLSSGICGALY